MLAVKPSGIENKHPCSSPFQWKRVEAPSSPRPKSTPQAKHLQPPFPLFLWPLASIGHSALNGNPPAQPSSAASTIPPPLQGQHDMARPIAADLRVIFYIILYFNICLLANALFLLTALLVMPFDGLAAYELNSQIALFLWSRMQYVFEHRHLASVTFSGDVLPEKENAIVLANHLSYSDFYLINGLAARKKMLPYCRWFAKKSLLWQLPIFGTSMYCMGFVMVARDWLKDSKSISAAFRGLKQPAGIGKKVWLVSFLEGTRLTEQKLQQSQEFCQKKGKKVLQNVLAPRTRGFVAAVQELRGSQVTHVYDLTLAYRGPDGFGKPPSLVTINGLTRLSPEYEFHVHVRRWSLKELPSSEAELSKWAEDVWAEKDEVLEGLKRQWINWGGLVGWGSKKAGKSGACGTFHDPLWPSNKRVIAKQVKQE